MAIETSSIRVGRCYLTHSNTVRRVLEVDRQSDVRCARETRVSVMGQGSWQSANKESFAREIDREVRRLWVRSVSVVAKSLGVGERSIESKTE